MYVIQGLMKQIINFLTENEVLWNVQFAGLLCCLQQYRPSFHIYNTRIKINLFCKIYNFIVKLFYWQLIAGETFEQTD